MVYTMTYGARDGYRQIAGESLSLLKKVGNLFMGCGVVKTPFLVRITDSGGNTISTFTNGFWVDRIGKRPHLSVNRRALGK